MSPAVLLDTAESIGLTLTIEGGSLTYEAPDTAEADSVLDLLREHREAVQAEIYRRSGEASIDPRAVWPTWRNLHWTELMALPVDRLASALRQAEGQTGKRRLCWEQGPDGRPMLGVVA